MLASLLHAFCLRAAMQFLPYCRCYKQSPKTLYICVQLTFLDTFTAMDELSCSIIINDNNANIVLHMVDDRVHFARINLFSHSSILIQLSAWHYLLRFNTNLVLSCIIDIFSLMTPATPSIHHRVSLGFMKQLIW